MFFIFFGGGGGGVLVRSIMDPQDPTRMTNI